MISSGVSICEFQNAIPSNNIYITLVCDDGTNAVAYSGRDALHLPSNFLDGIDSTNFICCGVSLDGVSYIDNYNVTTNEVLTNHYTEFLSPDKYSYYSLILNATSVLLSIIIIILYIIGVCNRGAENRVLRYMMHHTRRNTPIPLTNNLS
jgi:hypothetical protein